MTAIPDIFAKLRAAVLEPDLDAKARILRKAEAMCAQAAIDAEEAALEMAE